MSDLPGTGSIEYYLKGRAIRDQREARQAQIEAQQQKMQQDLQIANERQKEVEKYHGMQNKIAKDKLELDRRAGELNKAKYEADITEKLIAINRSVQNGETEFIDPQQGAVLIDPETKHKFINYANIRPTKKGTAAANRIQEKVDTEIGLTGPRITTAGGIAQAQVAPKAVLMKIGDELKQAGLEKQRVWQGIQNDKRISGAFARANLAKSVKGAEKDEMINEAVESSSQQVLEGGITLDDLNKNLYGENKVRVTNKFRGEGLRIINDTQRGDLDLLQNTVSRYRSKVGDLRDLINNQLDPRLALTDGNFKAKRAEIQQDLDAIGRALKGFKGQITERDTERLTKAIPDPNPGGWLSVPLSADRIREINNERVLDLDNFVQEKFNAITFGMKPEQKAAIKSRYSVPDPPKKSQKKKKEDELKIPKPSAMPFTSPPSYLKRLD